MMTGLRDRHRCGHSHSSPALGQRGAKRRFSPRAFAVGNGELRLVLRFLRQQLVLEAPPTWPVRCLVGCLHLRFPARDQLKRPAERQESGRDLGLVVRSSPR